MRALFRTVLVFAGLAAPASLFPTNAGAAGTVGILVVKEQGAGSAAQVQPLLDKFVDMVAKQNGWAGARGHFTNDRTKAPAIIQAEKPYYGIFSLGAFLALQGPEKLEIIGEVQSSSAGGQQYHVISKNQGTIDACKGKTLATNHGGDAKFIEKVVFDGKYKLGDFTVVTTTRPIQTIKKVAAGEAECALIDDAQMNDVGKSPETAGIKSVWKSAQFPALVMTALPTAPAAEKKAFQANIAKICDGAGQQSCKEVGIQSFKPAGANNFASIVGAYNK